MPSEVCAALSSLVTAKCDQAQRPGRGQGCLSDFCQVTLLFTCFRLEQVLVGPLTQVRDSGISVGEQASQSCLTKTPLQENSSCLNLVSCCVPGSGSSVINVMNFPGSLR